MLKQNAKTLYIKEQIVNDEVTGLTLIFSVAPNGEGQLRLLGNHLPFENRDFQFDTKGRLAGTGTGVRS
jgi:hypothetical protein